MGRILKAVAESILKRVSLAMGGLSPQGLMAGALSCDGERYGNVALRVILHRWRAGTPAASGRVSLGGCPSASSGRLVKGD